ncbi:hypothetical protein TNCV_4296841 [Trichonephila clavipes]|nr:hypothetical protein TNCV_4296841 [Trichonephila clavipes]
MASSQQKAQVVARLSNLDLQHMCSVNGATLYRSLEERESLMGDGWKEESNNLAIQITRHSTFRLFLVGIRGKPTRGLLETDDVILNLGQVTWVTPELATSLLTTTPPQWEDVSVLDSLTCIAAILGGSLMVLGSNS